MLTMHGGGTPKAPHKRHQYLPTLKRKHRTLKKIECTCAGMMRKSLDVQFGIWFSTWNVGSMLGKLCEIFETLKRCCVHICCLQVMDKYDRWKNAVEGKGLRVNVEKTKGWKEKGLKWLEMVLNFFGVGVVKENSCQMINWNGCVSWEVQQYSEVKSCYCPQVGRWENEKEEFHELMTRLWQVRRCW